EACTAALMCEPKQAAEKFALIVESYREELGDADQRALYENIQERRAWALVSQERLAEALPILKEAVAFTSEECDPPQSHYYLGCCYHEAGETDLAKHEYLRAIELGLESDFEGKARYRLSMLYFANAAFAQAKLHLENALSIAEKSS